MTVRNLCAHDITVFNRKAITRVTTAAGRNVALKEGDPIKLDKKRFTNYTATLRAFARALAERDEPSRRQEGVVAPLERPQDSKSVDGLLRCHLGHTYLEVEAIELAELARQRLGDESHVDEHGGAERCGRNSCGYNVRTPAYGIE
ncbi:hypothetical protein [Rhizobium yanglingense]